MEREDRNKTIIKMYQSGHTLQSVADLFGISKERVRQILSLNRIKDRHNGGKSLNYLQRYSMPEVKVIVDSYRSGESLSSLSTKFNQFSAYQLRKILEDAQVLRTPEQAKKAHPKRVPDDIRKKIVYLRSVGLTHRELAASFNLSTSGIVKILKEEST